MGRSPVLAGALRDLALAAPRAAARPAGVVAHPGGLALGDPEQLSIDLGSACGREFLRGGGHPVEQVHQLAPHQDVLEQRDGAHLGDDDGELAAHGAQPLAEVLDVAHGGRQRHDLHRIRQPEDHLLPHRAAEAVREVVHLVHHHVAEVRQRGRGGVDHVAQHLGGHHHDLRLGVDGGVARQQAHAVGAVAGDQVVVLLVGQRLDGRGVEALAGVFDGQEHGELAHHCLARPGGRGDQHPVAVGEFAAAVELVVVQFVGVEPLELCDELVIH